MAAADLCVQPSLTEGFQGLARCAGAGLPVIASRVGAAAAVIGENGERGWAGKAGDEAELWQ
jgi:glycosyltransferase involved in cell wall biosynthesis